jgi:hypothetical protein
VTLVIAICAALWVPFIIGLTLEAEARADAWFAWLFARSERKRRRCS